MIYTTVVVWAPFSARAKLSFGFSRGDIARVHVSKQAVVFMALAARTGPATAKEWDRTGGMRGSTASSAWAGLDWTGLDWNRGNTKLD
jgi:hypothetical protein